MRSVSLRGLETQFAALLGSITNESDKGEPIGLVVITAGEEDIVAVNCERPCTRDFVLPMIDDTVLNSDDREVCVGAAPQRRPIKC
jgi:hypothetical protein